MPFDLCIIGTGSGNSILDRRFDGQQVAIVDSGTFGGTCLNVGCIPTKMFVFPADLAAIAATSGRLGLDLGPARADWPAIRDRIFGRIDQISAAGERYRLENPDVTVFREEARFVGPRTLWVGDEAITAERFVIAAGSRPVVPDLPGLNAVGYHTSDTVMRLPELPRSMLIIGGGYVAAEFGHIFGAYGTAVTLVNRSDTLLRHLDADIRHRFTEQLALRIDLRLESEVREFVPLPGGRIRALVSHRGRPPEPLDTDVVLVAAGRAPNGDRLDLDATGVKVDADGFVAVDQFQRTSADGIFALGDVCSHRMLKHVANHEARVVQHNLLHPDAMIASDHRYIPAGIFSQPQIGTVGLTEDEAQESGVEYVVGRADYSDTAYGWAMEDRTSFCKVLADPRTRRLLGGHVIGPQATSLIQPIVQGLSFGLDAHELARGQYWPHPAMSEVVEQALLDLDLG